MKTSQTACYRQNVYLACMLSLLLFNSLSGQTETLPAKNERSISIGGFGHLSFSAEQLNLKNLNGVLSSNNYGTVDLNSISFGGGGAYVIKRFVIGGGGAWLMSSSTQNQVNNVHLKGSYGVFNLGYVLFSGKRSLLYPTLGFGGGGYNITVSKKEPQKDFTQQLNTPNDMITLDAGGLITTAQITYQYFFNKNAAEGFCLGIKAGYKYSPSGWSTSIDDTELSNAPKINMNGFYVTLVLGGGSVNIN